MMQLTRSKWFLPSFCAVLGAVFLAAQWAGGNPREGVYALVFMTALGLAILVGGRSEVVRGLRGEARDERFRTIDVHAGAFAGLSSSSRSCSR
jgi:hypothetical protein